MSEHSKGGRMSWLAVSTIILGFVLGALGLILGPTWWLFWVGVAVAGLGGIVGLAFDIFGDVTLDPDRGPQHIGRRDRVARGRAESQG
jgi:hypothetical protein